MVHLRGKGVQNVISISSYRWVFNYTTSATKATSSTNLMVDYFVDSLGFSKEEAIATASKVGNSKTTKKLDSVIDYLTQSGLNKTQIRNVVNCAPKFLSYKFDVTLKPKLKFFQDLGFNGSDLAHFILVNRRVWDLSLNAHILPTIELLKTVLTSDGNLMKALAQSPWLLWNSVPKYLPMNVALLKSYGFSDNKIEELLLSKPRYFIMDPKILQGVLTRVEETFGIPPSSPMFTYVVFVVSSLSEKTLESKVELLKSYGWTESDILWLIKSNPKCLTLSEATIRNKLSFFEEKLGYAPVRIAARPVVLNYSLEKRVIPRCAVMNVLKEKGLVKATYCYLSCLNIPESQFVNKFVLPFKEEVLNLYEDHMKSVGFHVQAAT